MPPHLLLASQRSGARTPELFEDGGWARVCTSVLSTSGLRNDALALFGFGPVVEHGVGFGAPPLTHHATRPSRLPPRSEPPSAYLALLSRRCHRGAGQRRRRLHTPHHDAYACRRLPRFRRTGYLLQNDGVVLNVTSWRDAGPSASRTLHEVEKATYVLRALIEAAPKEPPRSKL